LTCVNGTCSACGTVGNVCCAGNTCNGGTCCDTRGNTTCLNTTSCTTCGQSGESCCPPRTPGGRCDTNTSCFGGTCF
jgi:hypothetical protein